MQQHPASTPCSSKLNLLYLPRMQTLSGMPLVSWGQSSIKAEKGWGELNLWHTCQKSGSSLPYRYHVKTRYKRKKMFSSIFINNTKLDVFISTENIANMLLKCTLSSTCINKVPYPFCSIQKKQHYGAS